MLKSLSYVEECLNSLSDKQWSRQRTEILIKNIDRLLPDWRHISLLALLTPKMQRMLTDYVLNAQERDDTTLEKRHKTVKSIVRSGIQDGLLPNLPVFPIDSATKEIKGLKPLGYKEQIKHLINLYMAKCDAIKGVDCKIDQLRNSLKKKNNSEGKEDAAENPSSDDCAKIVRINDSIKTLKSQKEALERERRLPALAILSVLCNGIGLDRLISLRCEDFPDNKLKLSGDVTVGLPKMLSDITQDLIKRGKDYAFGLLKSNWSDCKKQRETDRLKKRVDDYVCGMGVTMPIVDDAFLCWTIVAQEVGADVEAIRASISNHIWGVEGLKNPSTEIEGLVRKVSAQFDEAARSWYCIMCGNWPRSHVKKKIECNGYSARSLKMIEPVDILFKIEDGRRIPYENPFFRSMLFINCNYREALKINAAIGSTGYLYGYADSEGVFHCRISDAEIDRLSKYIKAKKVNKVEAAKSVDLSGGVKVLFLKGGLKGLSGVVVSHDQKRGMSDVAIDYFGRCVSIVKGISDKHLMPIAQDA